MWRLLRWGMGLDRVGPMSWARILVDGYSLAHAWRELAPGLPRHSAAARDELVARMREYADAAGTPVTLVFDGQSSPYRPSEYVSTASLEILFSRSGQTADDVIERAACLLQPYGPILVVTNDRLERDTVSLFGATPCSCLGFVATVEGTIGAFQLELRRRNERERRRYQEARK